MRENKYVIRNAELWTKDGVKMDCSLWVENGKLLKISKGDDSLPSDYYEIDGSGKVVIPAGVDPQVHLRVPGQPAKETPMSGLRAAVNGGIAALLTMPNTKPILDKVEACQLAMDELNPAIEATGVKVLLSAAITKSQKGQELVDFQALADFGVAAFTDDGVGVMSDDLMEKALEVSESTGLPILQHAEMVGHSGVLAPGPVQERLGIPPYPATAETDMVARDLKLLEKYPKARYHVLHISSRDTLAMVGVAKANGLQASCEVSPHHLYFSSYDIDEHNTSFKMNPPLRSPEDKEALQIALATGSVDFVATDHAPHEVELKGENFKTSAYGTTGLETSLRTLLSLVAEDKLSREQLVKVFSYNPARFLSLDESFGDITPGETFRGVLVDPSYVSSVKDSDFYGLSKNSCFMGTPLHGRIEKVMFGDLIHTIN